MAIDDVAVRWSDYEQHKVSIESEFRNKLTEQLERLINHSANAGMNNHFISGMEYAKGLVQGLVADPREQEKLNHPSLF